MSDAPGLKLDAGKAPMRLLGDVPHALELLARVLDYGAFRKPRPDGTFGYGLGNWRKVERGEERYSDALARHVLDFLTDEELDPESGLPHLALAMANASFLLQKRHEADEQREKPLPAEAVLCGSCKTPLAPGGGCAICAEREGRDARKAAMILAELFPAFRAPEEARDASGRVLLPKLAVCVVDRVKQLEADLASARRFVR